jgi:hypothetical protein
MKAWRKKTSACQEATEACLEKMEAYLERKEPTPVETADVVVHPEVPNEEVKVKVKVVPVLN